MIFWHSFLSAAAAGYIPKFGIKCAVISNMSYFNLGSTFATTAMLEDQKNGVFLACIYDADHDTQPIS